MEVDMDLAEKMLADAFDSKRYKIYSKDTAIELYADEHGIIGDEDIRRIYYIAIWFGFIMSVRTDDNGNPYIRLI